MRQSSKSVKACEKSSQFLKYVCLFSFCFNKREGKHMKKAFVLAIALCSLMSTYSRADQERANVGFWGYHLILDCKACDKAKITDADTIRTFAKVLVKAIDMKAYGEPVLEHFATHNPLAGGYSLVQLIETSDITAHFVDLNGDAYIDIFSCKPFDIAVAQKVVQESFSPQQIRKTYLERQA
jgi:S-adenosylmethionine decarboxylase